MNVHQGVSRKAEEVALEIRVRGRVQGVGFRPTVWRIARELGLSGEVFNDADGVLIRVGGSEHRSLLYRAVEREPPPLGRIDRIETRTFRGPLPRQFRIAESGRRRRAHGDRPDAAICGECAAEIINPFAAPLPLCVRQLHPLRAATEHCHRHSLCPRRDLDGGICDLRSLRHANIANRGPPLSCRGDRLPDVRAQREADSPRRPSRKLRSAFHAATGRCGVKPDPEGRDRRDQGARRVSARLRCDECSRVARLRQRKHREAKPFALMARDLDMIQSYCAVATRRSSGAHRQAAAPIVLLAPMDRNACRTQLPLAFQSLGFMLPTTPLHLLILAVSIARW